MGWASKAHTLRAPAREEEQRGQRGPGRLNRVCNVVTHEVHWSWVQKLDFMRVLKRRKAVSCGF